MNPAAAAGNVTSTMPCTRSALPRWVFSSPGSLSPDHRRGVPLAAHHQVADSLVLLEAGSLLT